MKMVVLICSTVLPVVAHAQTTNPQTARSPLSLHDTVGAPDNLTLRASVRTRLESIDVFGVSTFETVWGFRLEEGFGLIVVT